MECVGNFDFFFFLIYHNRNWMVFISPGPFNSHLLFLCKERIKNLYSCTFPMKVDVWENMKSGNLENQINLNPQFTNEIKLPLVYIKIIRYTCKISQSCLGGDLRKRHPFPLVKHCVFPAFHLGSWEVSLTALSTIIIHYFLKGVLVLGRQILS